MVERYGIQDHDPQLTQHALQNPTKTSSPQNIGGGDDDVPPPSARGGEVPSFGLIVNVTRLLLASGRLRRNSLPVAVILALVFGPFGLVYTTWIGAGIVTALTALTGFVRGGSMAAVSDDVVMQPIWKFAVVASVVWTILAVRAHNARIAAPPPHQ
jgi:hypothetical protein